MPKTSVANPPKDVSELLARCLAIAGKTLKELSHITQIPIPKSLTKDKGFVGQLLEQILGATANQKPEPDFTHLAIELKTIPLNALGQPQETTFVCLAPNSLEAQFETWENSRLRKKLAKVLWIPVEADPEIMLPDRKIGMPLLWSMDPETENILKNDWEELLEKIQFGRTQNMSALYGQYLQLRPKAAHSRIVTKTVNEDLETVWIGPKGFYLRKSFTAELLKKAYATLIG